MTEAEAMWVRAHAWVPWMRSRAYVYQPRRCTPFTPDAYVTTARGTVLADVWDTGIRRDHWPQDAYRWDRRLTPRGRRELSDCLARRSGTAVQRQTDLLDAITWEAA